MVDDNHNPKYFGIKFCSDLIKATEYIQNNISYMSQYMFFIHGENDKLIPYYKIEE